jgi:UDP-N-acetylglucosamine acyltransferase
MGYVHFAHDCIIGDRTIIANGVQLAGHVHVGDCVVMGGTSVVHQFVRIGAHSMVGGASVLVHDVPPFILCDGHPAHAHGIHFEGLKRRGFTAEAVAALKRAYRSLYRENLSLEQARAALATQIAEESDAACAAALRALADFLAVPGRGIVR